MSGRHAEIALSTKSIFQEETAELRTVVETFDPVPQWISHSDASVCSPNFELSLDCVACVQFFSIVCICNATNFCIIPVIITCIKEKKGRRSVREACFSGTPEARVLFAPGPKFKKFSCLCQLFTLST